VIRHSDPESLGQSKRVGFIQSLDGILGGELFEMSRIDLGQLK
jgi:hypothetical protein